MKYKKFPKTATLCYFRVTEEHFYVMWDIAFTRFITFIWSLDSDRKKFAEKKVRDTINNLRFFDMPTDHQIDTIKNTLIHIKYQEELLSLIDLKAYISFLILRLHFDLQLIGFHNGAKTIRYSWNSFCLVSFYNELFCLHWS